MSVLAAFISGREARAADDQRARQSAMAQFLQQNGQAVFAGDQSALGQLAGFGPEGLETAFNIQGRQQQMAMDQERLQLARAEGSRAAQQFAMQMSAQERAAEAERLSRGLTMAGQFYQAGDQRAYNQMLAEFGLDPAQFPFESFPIVAAQAEGVLETLTAAQEFANPRGPEPTADQRNFEFAQQNPAFADFLSNRTPQTNVNVASVGTIPQGYELYTTPEGGNALRPIAGGPADTSAQDANKDRQGALRLGTSLRNVNLNLAEIQNGGLPVTGLLGDARRTLVGRALTGDAAFDFGNRTNQITDSAALQEIQYMRDNSPTGGAVGSLTDSERQAIGNAVTSLNSSTSAEEYMRAAEAYRTLALNLAFGEGKWQLGPDGSVAVIGADGAPRVIESGIAPSPPAGAQPAGGRPAGAAPAGAPVDTGAFRDAGLDALMELDVSTLSPADLRAFNARMKELLAQ